MPSQTNFHLVEGIWKSFSFKRIKPADFSRVLNHVNEFFLKEEPTCKLLGYNDVFAEQMNTVIIGLLNQNLSFLVEESSTKELAAVRITFRQSKNSAFEETIKPENLDWRTDAFLNSIDLTEYQRDEIFAKYGVTEYAELFIVATNPKFRNQGLSMELYLRSLIFLKAEGFKLVKCILTTPTTRRAGARLGFEEYCKLDYKMLKGRNGKLLFPEGKLIEEHFAIITLKKLL